MKGELQELGEEIDDNVVSTSKMQTEILNLTKGKVNIFEDDGKSFRNRTCQFIYNCGKSPHPPAFALEQNGHPLRPGNILHFLPALLPEYRLSPPVLQWLLPAETPDATANQVFPSNHPQGYFQS